MTKQSPTEKEENRKLYGKQAEKIELGAAIQVFAKYQSSEPMVGLIYSPEFCCFIRLNQQAEVQAYKDDKPFNIELASIFEARLFTPEAELRWLKTGPGHQGKAVVISENEIPKLDDFKPMEPIFQQSFTLIQQSYVLWGETDPAPPTLDDGWSMLATARIGRLPIPLSGKGDYAVLNSIEYLDCDRFGNVFVAQERLTKLEWKTYTNKDQPDD